MSVPKQYLLSSVAPLTPEEEQAAVDAVEAQRVDLIVLAPSQDAIQIRVVGYSDAIDLKWILTKATRSEWTMLGVEA